MHARTPANTGFKRQIVFRLGLDDWPLLEDAVLEHGSIQSAVLAGLRALGGSAAAPIDSDANPASEASTASPPARAATSAATPRPRKARSQVKKPREMAITAPVVDVPSPDPDKEIPARDAAKLLGLKTSTISGYIRSGRLPGRYDEAPSWEGWLTTRRAVDAYRADRG